MELGKLIKSEIRRQGTTQKSVSKQVGMSQTSLSAICTGYTFPRKKTFEKICKLLNIKTAFFIVRDSQLNLYDVIKQRELLIRFASKDIAGTLTSTQQREIEKTVDDFLDRETL